MNMLAHYAVQQEVVASTSIFMKAYVAISALKDTIRAIAFLSGQLDCVCSLRCFRFDLPFCIIDLSDVVEIQRKATQVTLLDHLKALGHLALGQLYDSIKGFITAVLQQIDKTFVNAFVLLPIQIIIFEDSVECFTEHICVDTKPATREISPTSTVWHPICVKIFGKLFGSR